jgi:hypothetical protein
MGRYVCYCRIPLDTHICVSIPCHRDKKAQSSPQHNRLEVWQWSLAMRLLGLIILIVIVVAVIKSGDKTADQSAPSAVSSASTTTTEKPKPKEKEIIPSPAGEEINREGFDRH